MTHAVPPLTDTWVPRSGRDTLGGYAWLPRLLDKARRVASGQAGAYLALDASMIDKAALAHWRVDGETLQAWLLEGIDDLAIADSLAARAGDDEAGRLAWSRRFLLNWGLVIALFDAEEGRRAPGWTTTLMTAVAQAMFAVVSRVTRPAG